MTIVLVTGATGFIGRNLIKKLSDMGYKVIGVSKKGGVVGDVLVDTVDCSDQEAINRYCNGKLFDAVFHLAAFIPPVPPAFSESTAKQSLIENVKMVINLLAICQKRRGIRLIYASSTSVYGYQKKLPVTEKAQPQPFGFYPLCKFFGELICQQYQKEHGLLTAILRISAPYGPGMHRETVIRKFIRYALLSEDITLYGTGNRSQDFVYIEDVTDAMVQAYQAKATGVFNVSSGTSTSMKELAKTVLRVLPDSKSRIIYADIADPQEHYRAAFSFEKAKKSFGYEPKVSLREGVQKHIEAIREESDV